MDIKKVLYYKEKKFYWRELDFHSQHGMIKEEELKKSPSDPYIKSNTGKEFLVLEANIQDNLEKIKRGPAIIVPKDIGPIVMYSNINKESKVIESGTGSGSLTINLARICKEVISYEKNKEFLRLAEKNLNSLDVKNVKLKNQDITQKIDETNIDTIILDLPNPEDVLENSHNALKPSGYLITYLPTINQVDKLIKACTNKFIHEKTIETLERSWHIEPHRLRPHSQMIAHTGFISFLRKI